MQFLLGYILGIITMTAIVRYLILKKNKIEKQVSNRLKN